MHNDSVTFVDVFRSRVNETPDRTALMYKEGETWSEISWSGWSDRSRAVAAGLLDFDFQQGECACILANSSHHWVIADIGILMAGGVTVPIYQSNTPEQCAYIIKDSGAVVVFAENAEQLEKLITIREDIPNVRKVVVFDEHAEVPEDARDWCTTFDALQELSGVVTEGYRRIGGRMDTIEADSTCTIVYTSGTTGDPKGVVLSHANFVYESNAVLDLGIKADDSQLLFLPLAHIFAKLMFQTWQYHRYITTIE